MLASTIDTKVIKSVVRKLEVQLREKTTLKKVESMAKKDKHFKGDIKV